MIGLNPQIVRLIALKKVKDYITVTRAEGNRFSHAIMETSMIFAWVKQKLALSNYLHSLPNDFFVIFTNLSIIL